VAILAVIDLGALWVGDVPQSPTRADFVDEAGNTVQISGYNSWSAYMLSPVGEVLGELEGDEHGQHLEFTWPTTTILEDAGVHTIVISFFDTNGVEVQCEPWKFIVQAIDGWLTLELARAQWADAPLDDVFLHQLLDTAKNSAWLTLQRSSLALLSQPVISRHNLPRHAPFINQLSLTKPIT
jgi:hypothetical protein